MKPGSARDWLPSVVLLLFVLGFMVLAAWVYAPFWEEAFRSDDSPVSWLSSALLIAGAMLCLRLCSERALPLKWGLPLALALLALALDEQFMLHEWFKHAFLPGLLHQRAPGGLADLPVLLVGFGGVLLAWAAGRCGFPRSTTGLLRAAVGVGLLAIWVDLGSPPVWLAFLEEGCEVLAEALFLSALLQLRQ
ncbi:hypothetical protein Q9Q94_03185 [Uliginosibacterium sp. 31-16]|uniref:hypothetical protein n=1 Tax=Uliginosibacterium sp. 31-16 TaxID=3068315 RepID=UPI00273D5726|nr:hypothetical protein [Uliginosibacterium sp. 31-16]MDP5238514.1 hypothetical protein [Uliginosibacterium sp. 31-16]